MHDSDSTPASNGTAAPASLVGRQAYLEAVRSAARDAIAREKFDEAVKREIVRLKTHVPFWHRVFPFRITITRR
jgi:predicted RNA-binding protein YlxR (DUF448 family)